VGHDGLSVNKGDYFAVSGGAAVSHLWSRASGPSGSGDEKHTKGSSSSCERSVSFQKRALQVIPGKLDRQLFSAIDLHNVSGGLFVLIKIH
jgi:hypothetical protein